MSDAELQEEEREVLLSIYDGDSAFKQLTPTTFQYKVRESAFVFFTCNNFVMIKYFCILRNNLAYKGMDERKAPSFATIISTLFYYIYSFLSLHSVSIYARPILITESKKQS